MIQNTQPQLQKRSHNIKSIAVVGGFLDGLDLDLSGGLNCLIGHRGAGKTTALEFVRHVLDAPPGRQSGPGTQKWFESLVAENLGDGRVRLRIETKDGIEYLVDRTAAGAAIVMDASGNPSDVSLANGGVFRADIYSQNEVERIADDPGSQLSLIDNFVSDEIHRVGGAIKKVEGKLSANGGKIADERKALEGVGDELSTLPGIQDKLKALAGNSGEGVGSMNHSHKLNAMRDREGRALASAAEVVQAQSDALGAMVGQLVDGATPSFDAEMLAGPNGELLQSIVREFVGCGDDVDKMLADGKSRIAAAEARVEELAGRLQAKHAEQELAFREILAKHTEAKGQEAERIRLETLQNQLLEKKRIRDDHLAVLKRLLEDRAGLLGQLSTLRDERYGLRKGVAETITTSLAPKIRVRVDQFGDSSLYRELLLEAMARTGINRHIVAQKIADNLSPDQLAAAVTAGDTKTLMERATLNANQATNVIASFTMPGMMFRLETIELADKPKIELLDGDTYKESSSLSTGQKCTTVLPILLLESDNPLLIDQPEDNLDNGFIYDTVVDSIRKVKGSRQMVFVTHNPNIPVLGDAEKVFVLRSNGRKAVKTKEGTVDECRDDIVALLEGGHEAFMKRKERYRF